MLARCRARTQPTTIAPIALTPIVSRLSRSNQGHRSGPCLGLVSSSESASVQSSRSWSFGVDHEESTLGRISRTGYSPYLPTNGASRASRKGAANNSAAATTTAAAVT